MSVKTLWLKLRALFTRRALDRELDEEIRFHLEMETDANRARGMTPAEARRHAYVMFGGVDRFTEGARDARGTRWLDDFGRDLRHGFRSLLRSPGFTVAALLTIALGVGASTSVFSVVRGVVLRPLPFADPDGLVMVWLNNPPQNIDEDVTSFPAFSAWREQSTTLSHVVGVRSSTITLTGGGEPEEARAALVTRGYFDMLGVPLALGRDFREDEVELDTDPQVVVLSHELWTSRFGADSTLIGRTIELNGVAHQVIGVAAAGSGYPLDVRVWLPLNFSGSRQGLREASGALWLPVMGRLAPGASFAQAQSQMDGVAARVAQADSASSFGTGIKLEPLLENEVGDVRAPLLTLLGAVVLVLLIAVANVANLTLARGTARSREMAVRLSLGAGRARLTRQVLTESALLGLLGAALGVGVTFAGVRLLLRLAPPELPRLDSVQVDSPVLVFALAMSIGASLLFGLIPALQAGRGGERAAMRSGTRGATDGSMGRARAALVATQFALALVLLVGSGLLVRSFLNVLAVDAGYETEGALTFRLSLPAARYPDNSGVAAFYDRLLAELESVPGVEGAALVSRVFISNLPNSAGITLESRPDLDTRGSPVPFDGASSDFIETLGMRLVAGRSFVPADAPDAERVAIVSEQFVRTFLSDREPVGERFVFGGFNEQNNPWIRIVGVVADARRGGLSEPVRPYIFQPMSQLLSRATDVVVRTQGDPLALTSSAREAVRALDPKLPVVGLRTMDEAVASSLAPRRFLMLLTAIFAAAATVLAAVGIYGVMAYMVGRRTREIGIQVALGAPRGAVVGGVLRQSMLHAGSGVALGIVGSLAATRYLQTQLFGLEATDPVTLVTMAALLVLVAAAASWIPALRAVRVDPAVALRDE
jgi:putative ABC transport system permease protein